MRTKTISLIVCLLLFAVSALTPTKTQAHWGDDHHNCVAQYVTAYNESWATYEASAQTEADWNYHSANLTWAFNTYQGCNGVLQVDTAAYDFCSTASQAAQYCALHFSADFAAWTECRAAARVDQCQ